jgi:hypothetical protein
VFSGKRSINPAPAIAPILPKILKKIIQASNIYFFQFPRHFFVPTYYIGKSLEIYLGQNVISFRVSVPTTNRKNNREEREVLGRAGTRSNHTEAKDR